MAKNNKVFVDSNFFIALFNPADQLHLKAITVSQKIKEEKPLLISSDYIFLEVVTILSQRISKKAAVTFGKHMMEDKAIKIIHVNEELHQRTWAVFSGVINKNVSFIDCSSLAIVKEEGVKEILTFDKTDFNSLQRIYKFKYYA